MNRRSLLSIALVVLSVLGVAALILAATAPARAQLYSAPAAQLPVPHFAPFIGLPEKLPPQLRTTYNTVSHTPRAPYATPDVLLFKWTPGNQARPGGVMVYSVYYANIGYADAANVIITDTLPAQTTYAGDTSGLPMTSAGGVITWTIGTLPARTEGAFNLTLNVDPAASIGSTLPDNCARINTATSGDNPANNTGCAGGVTIANSTIDISVQTWPGGFFDAAAGQDYLFNLQVCNFTGTPAGPVRITDTLPLSTTFVRWQANGFWPSLWKQISQSGNTLVLETSGFPNTCDEVRLTVLVDAATPPGTRLLNQLRGYTPGDTEPNN
ncbi:MAG TPA: hypothetical protein VFF59_10770, partial [Anaerolineae bacterium]|nr:hypothetical protein [Anaerolineae bacterium]